MKMHLEKHSDGTGDPPQPSHLDTQPVLFSSTLAP